MVAQAFSKMSEKLCLKWNDFQENVNVAFGSLREDSEFADVTLACEDGQQIEVHKVILAASSPSFQSLLKRNRNPHPLIYMRGVKSENLIAIVDFLYFGEANVYQDNLDSFLAIAEELRLKGLMGQTENAEKTTESTYTDPTPEQINPKPIYKKETFNTEQRQLILEPNLDIQSTQILTNSDHRIAIPNFVTGDLMQELDKTVKSMMEKGQNISSDGRQKNRICKICGKEGQWVAIRDHIEMNHLEGVSLPCNVCGKIFRSRTSLRQHKCSGK